jgi:23S rRNA (uracil1939-C5)-methyltransferase
LSLLFDGNDQDPEITAPQEAMGKRFLVKIDDMAFRGYGVARIEGKVVFVPFSATGDEAWIEIEEEKKSYAIGRLKEITRPSSWRVEPPCPYFGACGGCQWQHIDYSFHGEIKKRILEDILRRMGKAKETPAITVVPSPRAYEYRTRVQLKVETGRMGYYRERSHELVEIDRCLISHPLINRIISSIRDEISAFPPLEGFEINVSPEEEKGVLLLHVTSDLPRQKSFAESLLRSNPVLKGLAVIGEKASSLYGDPFLHLAVPSFYEGQPQGLKLRSSPGSFFQVNPDQNQRLIETVLKFVEVKRGERVLDLYAGIGNLTLPLAARTQEVYGIEENTAAVKDAGFNAASNGLEGCAFIHGRVEKLLGRWEKGKPDVIVLDPPRGGCIRIMDRIAGLMPGRIVYVSCDPSTFARDIRLFSEKGFELRRLTLIDMFPQSYHMEVVVLLTP